MKISLYIICQMQLKTKVNYADYLFSFTTVSLVFFLQVSRSSILKSQNKSRHVTLHVQRRIRFQKHKHEVKFSFSINASSVDSNTTNYLFNNKLHSEFQSKSKKICTEYSTRSCCCCRVLSTASVNSNIRLLLLWQLSCQLLVNVVIAVNL